MDSSSALYILVFTCVCIAGYIFVNLGSRAFAFYQKTFTSQAETNLEKMFLFFDYDKMFFTNIAIIFLVPGFVYLISGNAFYTVLSLAAVIAMPKIIVKVLDKKRKEKLVEALPDALAQISGSMRSGSTFTSSIELMVNETKGPLSQEFALLLKEQKIGISQQEALENMGERVDSEDLDLVITAALIARDVGGNLSETLERLSDMLRRKIEMESKMKALTSQGKLQGWGVGALPFGIIFALSYVEPEGIMPIFSTFLGWGFLAVILILELLGGVMIRKIVSIDV